MTKSYESQLADAQAHLDSMMPPVDEQAEAREREIDRVLFDHDDFTHALERSGYANEVAEALFFLRHHRVTHDGQDWPPQAFALDARIDAIVAAWVDEQLRRAIQY